MKLAHQLLETALVLVSGIIALLWGIWRYGLDVFLTTGARVVDIWRK